MTLVFFKGGVGGLWLFLVLSEVMGVTAVIRDEFYFIRRVGALHIIFNDVVGNAIVGFVSKGGLVLVEYFMGDAIRGGKLRGGEKGFSGSVDGDGWVGTFLVLAAVVERVIERVCWRLEAMGDRKSVLKLLLLKAMGGRGWREGGPS